jgi:hypothetical protein
MLGVSGLCHFASVPLGVRYGADADVETQLTLAEHASHVQDELVLTEDAFAEKSGL